jgi:hypothetical protein
MTDDSLPTYKHLRAWSCTEPDRRVSVAGTRCDPTMYPASCGAPNTSRQSLHIIWSGNNSVEPSVFDTSYQVLNGLMT